MESAGPQSVMSSKTKTIARNSFWIGVEVAVDMAISFVTSVLIARGIGPSKLGYFVYLTWLSGIAAMIGNLGIPAAVCKYMAEYLGAGDRRTARSIFRVGMRIQVPLATVISAIGVTLVVLFGDPVYRIPGILLVCSVLPAMINSIATSANIGAENPAANVPGSFASSLMYAAIVGLALHFDWGVTGIAAGLLSSRAVELVVRLVPTLKWLKLVPPAPLSPEMRKRFFLFAVQGLALLILGLVVWDRSEILFLKRLTPDVRQLAFYSVAFGITEKLHVIIRVVSNSIGVTVRVQYGRDRAHLVDTVQTAVRYLFVISLPLFVTLAVLSGPLITVIYGDQYLPAITVLTIAALFALPKVLLSLVQVFLQSAERQSFVVRWMMLAAAANLLLDWFFILHYAAIGGAIANGIAQLFGVAGLWIYTAMAFGLKVPGRLFALLAAPVGAVVLALLLCRELLPPVWALVLGPPAAILIYSFALRFAGVLQREDRDRFRQFRSSLPRHAVAPFDFALNFLMPLRVMKMEVK